VSGLGLDHNAIVSLQLCVMLLLECTVWGSFQHMFGLHCLLTCLQEPSLAKNSKTAATACPQAEAAMQSFSSSSSSRLTSRNCQHSTSSSRGSIPQAPCQQQARRRSLSAQTTVARAAQLTPMDLMSGEDFYSILGVVSQQHSAHFRCPSARLALLTLTP
jgi:hypothetical protein